jgi:hypothetical protein
VALPFPYLVYELSVPKTQMSAINHQNWKAPNRYDIVMISLTLGRVPAFETAVSGLDFFVRH